jgi:hypothetical protein
VTAQDKAQARRLLDAVAMRAWGVTDTELRRIVRVAVRENPAVTADAVLTDIRAQAARQRRARLAAWLSRALLRLSQSAGSTTSEDT